MESSICLLGRDFPDLGPLGVVGYPDRGAIALSRGALGKPYPHLDPNEDGALLVRSSDAALLVVADGHNGARACEAALAATRARANALLQPGDGFAQAVVELIDEIARRLTGARRSRTCLLVARVIGPHCEFASFGDSTLLRARKREPLNAPNALILGPRRDLRAALPILWYGAFERDPGERIAAVTDGVTNFVPEAEELRQLLADSPDDLAAARALAERAMRGGAGDNVAVCAFS
jgi:serine/threonine protein phosphatase PrpC